MLKYTRESAPKNSYVYILSNEKRSAFHVDITSNLHRRMDLHVNKPKGMVKDRGVNNLVYVEKLDNTKLAIDRQREIKALDSADKIKLIIKENAEWKSMNEDYLK